jgi:small subunit ribosomal protein S3
MIERKVVQQKMKEYLVQNYVSSTLRRVGHSKTTLHRNPLGERILISASRPGLIVGSKGANIKKLTKVLKAKFKLENPQIEIEEVKDAALDPVLVAEYIASTLERFGTTRFKGVGYKSMESAMRAGALGIEIMISGKIPSSRAKRWRFFTGYLKKCGDLSVDGVLSAYDVAQLKTGIVGIQVRIMPPSVVLPDTITITQTLTTEVGEIDASGDVIKDETTTAQAEAQETENVKKIKKKTVKKTAKKESVSTKPAEAAPEVSVEATDVTVTPAEATPEKIAPAEDTADTSKDTQ